MQFLIIARDDPKPGTLDRRMSVRADHVTLGDRLVKTGNMLYGAAMLADVGPMVGSVLVVEFESRIEVDEWLSIEPYVTANVWKEIEVMPTRVGPSFQHLLPQRPPA